MVDALMQSLGGLSVPVLYDADIGHVPPQMQIVNGAIGKVDFIEGKATLNQKYL
jgi:muramoyltetrapeptide carboxypeptidase LdcA involved in peptidoglycan recycling